MAADDKPDQRRGGTHLAPVPPSPALPRRRAVLLAGLLACTALGGLVVGRWWSVRRSLAERAAQPVADPSAAEVAPPSPAPRPTPAAAVAEARQLAEELLQNLPDQPPALVLAGRAFYAFNDVARAQQCWETCLTRDPEHVEARCAMAEAAWEHGAFDRTAKHLDRVFDAHPQLDQKSVFFLADALMNLGETGRAAEVLERAARANPLPPFGTFLLGQAYLQMDEYEQARQQFAAVLAADPQAINAHYGLATVYTRLDQPEQARAHKDAYARLRKDELAESARLRPAMRKADWADPIPVLRECHLNAGKVYAQCGRWAATERHWLRAAALDPDDPRPRLLLRRMKGEG